MTKHIWLAGGLAMFLGLGQARAAQYELTVVPVNAPAGAGVVSIPAGIDCPDGACGAMFDGGTIFNPSYIRLIATLPAGWSVTWTGGLINQNPDEIDVFLTSDTTITATFTPTTDLLPLTVTLLGSGTGFVGTQGGGILCGNSGGNHDCDEDYPPSTPPVQVELTQHADPGSTFAGWGGACSGSGACVVTMDQARNVTATFNLITAELPIIDAMPGDAILCSGESVALHVAAHAQSGASLTYQWRQRTGQGFEPIPGAEQPDYEVAVEGVYDVLVQVTGGGSITAPPNGATVAENSPPVPGPDVLVAVTGKTLLIPVAALLINDSDAEGSPLHIISVEVPPQSLASVTLDAVKGVIRYQPATSEIAGSFSYQVTDGICSAMGNVEVKIEEHATPQVNELLIIPPKSGVASLALPFVAPATADFSLERAALGGGTLSWNVIVTDALSENQSVVYSDPDPPANGAIYRVERRGAIPP